LVRDEPGGRGETALRGLPRDRPSRRDRDAPALSRARPGIFGLHGGKEKSHRRRPGPVAGGLGDRLRERLFVGGYRTTSGRIGTIATESRKGGRAFHRLAPALPIVTASPSPGRCPAILGHVAKRNRAFRSGFGADRTGLVAFQAWHASPAMGPLRAEQGTDPH